MTNDAQALSWANAALLPSLILRLYQINVISYQDGVQIVDGALLQLENLQSTAGPENEQAFILARKVLETTLQQMEGK